MGSIKIVKASAGSGKTYRLTAEYIAEAMTNPPHAFKSILAVTFTNKATSEMKERILAQLHSLSRAQDENFAKTIQEITGYSNAEITKRAQRTLTAILSDYSSFTISTIDKFFQRIVRSFFRELDLDVSYEVVIDQKATISEAINSLIERSLSDKELSKKFNNLIKARLSEGKKVNLHRELTTLLSGAMSSTTELNFPENIEELERDLEELVQSVDEDKVRFVALCKEVCDFLRDNSLAVEDFKGSSRSFATYFKKIATLNDIAPYGVTFAKVAGSEEVTDYMKGGKLDSSLFEQIKNYTQEVKDLYDSTLPKRVTAMSLMDNFLRYSLLSELVHELSELNSLKCELPISSTTKLLCTIVDSASVPFIFERLGSRYSTIFIDEFQDTSTGQWAGFLPLVVEAASKSEEKLSAMLIGDVKQAIYRWRGGDWKLLDRGIYASEGIYNATEEWLDTSWRSELNIVNFNNLLFRNIVNRGTSKVLELTDGFDDLEAELSTYLSSGYNNFEQRVPEKAQKRAKGYIEIRSCEEEERIAWSVNKIIELRERYTPSKIAILVSRKVDGAKIAAALTSHGIEFMSDELLKVGGSATICFIIEALRYISTRSLISRQAMVEHLGTLELSDDEELLREENKYDDILSLVERVVMLFKLSGSELYYLQTLYNIVHSFMKNSDGGVQEFLTAWDDGLSDQAVALPEVPSAVKILTIHKSKGLEYDAVVVPYCTWKLLPSHNDNFIWIDDKDGKISSELKHYPIRYNQKLRDSYFANEYITESVASVVDNINLLYVALTRAKEELYIGLAEPKKDTSKIDTIGDLLHSSLPTTSEPNSSYGAITHKSEKTISTTSTEELEPLYVDKIISYNLPPLKELSNIEN